jgi:hypothetical protein
VFSFYGLPPFGAYYRAIALKAAQFEEQGQRLHPELDLLDDRSRSQFLGMMSVLIGVQPSEIMRLKKPEELGGFVDVALGMQSNFSKPLMVTSAAVPLLEDGNTVTSTSPTGVPDYIDLDQSAALVGRSKRTLERRLRKMPPPAIKGSGGKKSEWLWSVMRPWLEKEFGRKLPDRPPHIARR